MDWKATARIGKPFVRVYTEERDRPAILAIDQRINMFFGSRRATKSALAAEIAALASWRILAHGDRVGGVVFGDDDAKYIQPLRDEATVMRLLETTVTYGARLRADYQGQSNPGMLNRILFRMAQRASHSHLIAVVSDYSGANDETRHWLSRLAQRNDVVLFFVYDRLAKNLPDAGNLIVSDGELQIELPFANKHIRKSLAESSDSWTQMLLGWQRDLGIPVLPVCTWEDPLPQIRKLLGTEIAGRL